MTVLAPSPAGARAIVHDGLPSGLAQAWDDLAAGARSPLLSHAWLRAWCDAFAPNGVRTVTLQAPDGELRGAACLIRRPGRGLAAAANSLSDGWDAVARDDAARHELWREVAALPAARVELTGLLEAGLPAARQALSAGGYRLIVRPHEASPWLVLPASADELLASVSRNLRSQVGRFRRRLEREGDVRLRTAHGPEIDDDLERFLEIEASGWKGARGTAIRSDARAVRLYLDFARAAADRGWLRLRFLELDGDAIAADLSCVLGGGEHLLKTAFDERHARLSPGVVLRAEVLAAAIAEGLTFYDFLGGPDRYKLQWTDEVRERFVVHAYRGMPGPGRLRLPARPAPRRAPAARGGAVTTPSLPPAIVASAGRQGLAVTRGLGERGAPVVVLHWDDDDLAAASRYATRTIRVPRPELDGRAFVDRVLGWPTNWPAAC